MRHKCRSALDLKQFVAHIPLPALITTLMMALIILMRFISSIDSSIDGSFNSFNSINSSSDGRALSINP